MSFAVLRLAALVLAATIVVTVQPHGASAASDASKPFIGRFGEWEAFHQGKGRKKVCYVASIPKKSKGKYKKRGDIQAFVAHHPNVKVLNEVSFNAGYTYRKGSEVKVVIGKKSFSLFTKDDTAWARDKKTDFALVHAMERGADLVVKGVSSRGTRTTDIYSLKGFTAAYKAMNKVCGVKLR